VVRSVYFSPFEPSLRRMKSSYWIKGAIFSTFFVCCIITILLCASMATDFWVTSTAKRNITQQSSGNINFGLFNGKKVLNSGLGDRTYIFKVTTLKQTEPEFMLFGLWVATIAMMAAAILFVLVAAMFAILNTATNPVETITGVVGLYVWNGIAMFFELLVLILWGIQFHKKLSHSVLWREELVQQWSSDGLASLGYSYWLVFVAFILHVVNMAILWFGTHQKRPKKVQIPVERGNTNAVNMIY